MTVSGGCACGAVRYELAAAPYDAGWCHCRLCQRVSGAPGMVFTTAKLGDYRVTKGEERVGRFASTPFGERTYCRDCGSPLTIHVSHQPDEIDVAAGTLDDPEAARPGFHIFAGEAPAWLAIDDGLPVFDKLRPDMRGLEPGQVEA